MLQMSNAECPCAATCQFTLEKEFSKLRAPTICIQVNPLHNTEALKPTAFKIKLKSLFILAVACIKVDVPLNLCMWFYHLTSGCLCHHGCFGHQQITEQIQEESSELNWTFWWAGQKRADIKNKTFGSFMVIAYFLCHALYTAGEQVQML